MPTPQRLPIVNSDDGVWGDIIRQYLMKEHYDDGTDNAVNGGHQKITVRAGSATAGTAPIKLTSGVLMTTPEAGAIEFNSDALYFTQTTGPTRKKIAIYDDASGATGDIYYRNSSGLLTRLGAGSTGDYLTIATGIPSWTSSIVGKSLDNTNTVTLKDTLFTLQDATDTTKQVRLDVSASQTTGTTRTITLPTVDSTLATLAGTESLTNKTIVLPQLDSIYANTSNLVNANYLLGNNSGGYPAFSPVPKYLWHDNLRFNRWTGTPSYETYNGAWSSQTLDTTPFSGKEAVATSLANGTTVTAVRWTWNNGNFAFGYNFWWCIGFPYIGATAPTNNVLIESSPDGSAWTTRHTSSTNANGAPVWFSMSDNGGHTYIRLTITNTNSLNISVTSIKALSPRWSNQGGGSEYEYPYDWDKDRKMTIGTTAGARSDGVLNIGATSSTTAADGMFFGNDTNLYRSATNTLKTDDALIIGTAGTAAGSAVTIDGTQTLTGKSLTAPRITSGSNIADSNGNELIIFPSAVASAVNEITISNAATGNKPTIAASGGDTNVTLNLTSKGTGTVQANGIDVVTTTAVQTLTNKDLSSSTNILPSGVVLRATVVANSSGTKTYTIASGSITQISGTTVDGIAISIGDKILVNDSPAATGVANGITTQPGNGLYIVTGNTTNLTVSRASEMSGSNSPVGKLIRIERGTFGASGSYAGSTFAVTTPTSGVFTYGTTSMGLADAYIGQNTINDSITFSVSSERSAAATLTNKRITPRVGTTTSTATPAINTDNFDVYTITALATNITSFTMSGTPTDGQKLRIAITGTATRTIAWGTSFEASTVALPTATSGTARLDTDFIWNAATSKWRVAVEGNASSTFSDSAFTLQDNGDATKQAKFELSSIATGNVRTYTLPDSTTTVVGTDAAQTLTNKTITNPKINNINDTNGNAILGLYAISSAVNFAYITNQSAGNYPTFGVDGADANIGIAISPKGSGPVRIFTNTGQVPTLEGIDGSGNTDLNLKSNGTGKVKANGIEIATISGAQTLTNKVISGANNTLLAIPVSAISASGTAASTTFLRGDGVWSSAGSTVSEYTSSTGGVTAVAVPANVKGVYVTLIGGGGGGGSGRLGAASTIRYGGAGGAGGNLVRERLIPASALGATYSVTVGPAGVGGAMQTTNSTDGNPGTAGGDAVFTSGSTVVTASGGGGGAGGNNSSTPAAGTPGLYGDFLGSPGGAGSQTAITPGTASAVAVAGALPYLGGSGGGGAVGLSAGGTTGTTGGAGGANGPVAGGTGGLNTGTFPTSGSAPIPGQPGSGGGGGAYNTPTSSGQAGGSAPGYGGGGGGGGGAVNGVGSGAGGNGGPAYALITWVF